VSPGLSYTLIFGNNFIFESPKSIKIYDKILFSLSENTLGPYLSTEISDNIGNQLVKVEQNACIYYREELINKSRGPEHILIININGENILESRVLDKKTILVSGMFAFPQFMLIATQNYILMPNGKRLMHSRVNAKNGDVAITEDGLKST
jgi:hypothetical protein